jgi:hypothetical protein
MINSPFAGDSIRIAELGFVRIREELRFVGKIMGAVVSFCGGRWFISIQVDTDGVREAVPGTFCGVDLGSLRWQHFPLIRTRSLDQSLVNIFSVVSSVCSDVSVYRNIAPRRQV